MTKNELLEFLAKYQPREKWLRSMPKKSIKLIADWIRWVEDYQIRAEGLVVDFPYANQRFGEGECKIQHLTIRWLTTPRGFYCGICIKAVFAVYNPSGKTQSFEQELCRTLSTGENHFCEMEIPRQIVAAFEGRYAAIPGED